MVIVIVKVWYLIFFLPKSGYRSQKGPVLSPAMGVNHKKLVGFINEKCIN